MEPPVLLFVLSNCFPNSFVFKIGPILVVRVKIRPAPPTILIKNGKIAKKVYFDSSKEASYALNATQKNPSSLQSTVSEKIKKILKQLPFLAILVKNCNFWKFFLIFSETIHC